MSASLTDGRSLNVQGLFGSQLWTKPSAKILCVLGRDLKAMTTADTLIFGKVCQGYIPGNTLMLFSVSALDIMDYSWIG